MRSNLTRQGDVVNRARGLAGGKDQQAKGYSDDDEEREEKFEKRFGKEAVHVLVVILTHAKSRPHPPAGGHEAAFAAYKLRAGDVDGARALLAFCYFKVDGVAFFELIKHYTTEILGVKEEILRLAFARDESESSIPYKGLDSSCHVFLFFLCGKPDLVS